MMISSKPSDRSFLDHDIVEDDGGRIYVVVGNSHPPNGLIAYLKYVPVYKPTLWRGRNVWYERALKYYGVRNVREVMKKYGKLTYDPSLHTHVPFIELSSVSVWYRPEEGLRRIMHEANDSLEIYALEAIDRIRSVTSIPTCSLGIGGSILLGIHNVKHSDINIVVYGCKEATEIVYSRTAGLDPLPENIIRKRLCNQSMQFNIPLSELSKINPPYKMRSIKGRPVGLTFVSRQVKRYCEKILVPKAPIEAVLEVVGGDCRSLQYPSITEVIKVKKVFQGSRVLKNIGNVKFVISYESLFNYVLFKGGDVRVKGILEEVYPGGENIILVGGFEEPGYVLPVS